MTKYIKKSINTHILNLMKVYGVPRDNELIQFIEQKLKEIKYSPPRPLIKIKKAQSSGTDKKILLKCKSCNYTFTHSGSGQVKECPICHKIL